MKDKKTYYKLFANMEPVQEDVQPVHIHAKTLVSTERTMALDAALPATFQNMYMGGCSSTTHFLGYPFLQWLAQNALISSGVETIADEMTRKWGKVVYTGTDGTEENKDSVKILESALRRFKVQDMSRRAAEMIGYYGGCLVYIDTGARDPETLKAPLYLDPATFPKNSLKGLVLVDPVNCSPANYNSADPTRADYFVPETWSILGKEIHKSRLLYFCGKEAPLLFKPSYNFFGISSSQLAWEYVENFTKNRNATSELLTKFSTTVMKLDLQSIMLSGGQAKLEERVRYTSQMRNNNGVVVLDKEDEDFVKVETSMSGVTEITRQAMEFVATVFRIPAVKFLGISPSGFNATGESDITNFYDLIMSLQQKQLAENVEKIMRMLQLNELGVIDEAISFEFGPLSEEDTKAKADTEKVKADTVAVYIGAGVVSPEEARQALADDKEGLFSFIDPEGLDEMDDMGEGLEEGFEDVLKVGMEEEPKEDAYGA